MHMNGLDMQNVKMIGTRLLRERSKERKYRLNLT